MADGLYVCVYWMPMSMRRPLKLILGRSDGPTALGGCRTRLCRVLLLVRVLASACVCVCVFVAAE